MHRGRAGGAAALGEPDRAAQGGRPGAPRAGEYAARQLGLHGDGGAGVEPPGSGGFPRTPVAAAPRGGATAAAAYGLRTFLGAFIVPCHLTQGRRVIYRLLAWNPWQYIFFRRHVAGGAIDRKKGAAHTRTTTQTRHRWLPGIEECASLAGARLEQRSRPRAISCYDSYRETALVLGLGGGPGRYHRHRLAERGR